MGGGGGGLAASCPGFCADAWLLFLCLISLPGCSLCGSCSHGFSSETPLPSLLGSNLLPSRLLLTCAQDTGELQVIDSLGDVVWSSGDSPVTSPGQATQLISDGVKELSCLFSGPQPAATALADSSDPLQVLRVSTTSVPQLLDIAAAEVLWTPSGYPSQPSGSYSMCLTTNGTLQTSRLSGTGGTIWRAPAQAPASPSPFVLMVSGSALHVLDRNCRRAYTSASIQQGAGAANKRAAKQGTQQARSPPGSPPQRPARLSKPALKLGSFPAPPPPPKQQAAKPPATRAAKPSARKPPAQTMASFSSICGGVNLCGLDAPCSQLVSCGAGSACSRRSQYLWQCLEK